MSHGAVTYRSESAEALRLIRDHGFDRSHRLVALRSLVRSRGVPLEDVLRAALRGDLRWIVLLPAIPPEMRGAAR